MNDFEKLLNDAKLLSGLIGEGAGDGNNNTSANLFNNMAQITNMMEIIKSFRSVGQIPERAQAPTLSASPVSNQVSALLAMAPYMGEANRKNIIIAAKLMELMHFVNNFEETLDIRSASVEESEMDNRNMLLAARPYIEDDKRDMVDLLINVMDISEVLKKIERMNQDAY